MGVTLGLVAGSGRLPFEVAEAARERGVRLAIAAIEQNTDPAIESLPSDAFAWLAAGELGKLIEFLKGAGAEMVLSPDEGSVSRARIVGQIIGTSVDYLEKTRIDGETVKITTKMLDVYRKRVAIVDDIIATGGTIVEAAKQLKDQGAKEVIAACTHGLYAQGALEKLEKVVDTIVSSDTIENETSAVSVAPELAKSIKNYQ